MNMGVAVKFLGTFVFFYLLMVEGSFSHARLVSPQPRTNETGLKVGPCGNRPKTQTPSILNRGSTITVMFRETVEHPSYYQFSFSSDNDQTFSIIGTFNGDIQGGALPHEYSFQITLPNITCNNCTLRLIQWMTENPANPTPYYSCADVTLQEPNGGAPVTPPVTNPGGDDNSDQPEEDHAMHDRDHGDVSLQSNEHSHEGDLGGCGLVRQSFPISSDVLFFIFVQLGILMWLRFQRRPQIKNKT